MHELKTGINTDKFAIFDSSKKFLSPTHFINGLYTLYNRLNAISKKA